MNSDELQRHLDEAAIARQLALYCRGVDRLDEELLRSVYHEDSTDDHGLWKGRGVDFAAYCVRALRGHAEATHHSLGQVLYDWLGPDAARVESYVTAVHRREVDGRPLLETVGARYVDRFERRAAPGWKIADRVVLLEWSRVDRPEATFPDEGFTRGRRDHTDPCYGKAP